MMNVVLITWLILSFSTAFSIAVAVDFLQDGEIFRFGFMMALVINLTLFLAKLLFT